MCQGDLIVSIRLNSPYSQISINNIAERRIRRYPSIAIPTRSTPCSTTHPNLHILSVARLLPEHLPRAGAEAKQAKADVEAEKEVAVSGRRAFTPTNYDSRRFLLCPPLKAFPLRTHRPLTRKTHTV